MKVNICGIPYEIEDKDDNFDSDAIHFSQIDYKNAKIVVNKNLAPEVRNETICHEIVHGMLLHIGRNDLTNDECFVQALGNAISQGFDIKYTK